MMVVMDIYCGSVVTRTGAGNQHRSCNKGITDIIKLVVALKVAVATTNSVNYGRQN